MCVCVCVFDIAYSPHPPLHPPGIHSPIIWSVGGPRLYLSRFFSILARGSIHPLYHGDTVCVCVCVFGLACSSHPALHLPDAHSPFIYIVGGGGHAYMCQDCFQSLSEAQSTLCHGGHCVCVCMFAIACSPHHPLRPPDVHGPLI